MKPWTIEFIISILLALVVGTLIAFTQSGATLFFFGAGLTMGYGLRLSVVNVWPHIFKPRIAFKKD